MQLRFPSIVIWATLGLCSSMAQKETTTEDGLIAACEKGNTQAVEKLLEHPGNLEARDPRMGWTPLMWAANNNRPAIVRLLLDHGADVNAKDVADQTSLKLGIRCSASEVFHLLLDRGANVFVKGKMGDTLLPEAVLVGNAEAVAVLLKRGVDVNAANSYGSTPLHAAALSGRAEIAGMLLEAGADVNARNKANATPLILAVQAPLPARSFLEKHEYRSATQTVKVLLLHRATIDAQSRTVARENGMKEISKLLQAH